MAQLGSTNIYGDLKVNGTITGTLSGNATTATTATKLGSTTIGSDTKPIYLNAGTATASTSTVGSSVKPVFLSSGTITASSSTVGGATQPIYLSAGTITAGTSLGNLAYLNKNSSTVNFLRGDGTWVTPPNTDTSCTAVGNHYTPTSDSSSVISSGVINTSTPTITWSTDSSTPYSLVTGLTINRDAKGHVTGASVSTANFPKLTSITQLGTITSALNVSGVASFTNATASTSTTTGAVKISGGLGVAGNIYGSAVYNAVWNDLSDCIEVDTDCNLEAGYCYCFDGTHYYKSDKYLADGIIGINSDTYGMNMGRKPNGCKQMDVAVAGFVLAFVDKEYKVGTPLTCTKDGKLTKIKFLDRVFNPHKIVATYWKSEPQEEWGNEDRKVKVNGRKWVKIK